MAQLWDVGRRSRRKRKVTAEDSEGEASADDASSQEDTDVETTMDAGKHWNAFRMCTVCQIMSTISSI